MHMQLYGPVKKAPDLAGTSLDPSHAASSQQLATSQQLASCLATPFTGDTGVAGDACIDQALDQECLTARLRDCLPYFRLGMGHWACVDMRQSCYALLSNPPSLEVCCRHREEHGRDCAE